jgi:hypothetical protein
MVRSYHRSTIAVGLPDELPGIITPQPRKAEKCQRCNGTGQRWVGKGKAINGMQIKRGSVYPCVWCSGRGWL